MAVTPGDIAPEAVWSRVSDALLAGLTHDLNGRVAALNGLLHVVSLGNPAAEVMSLLLQEGDRLEETVALLRRYPRGSAFGPEAFDPREVAEGALALHLRREDRAEAEIAYAPAQGGPAARAERIATGRALLVLLARADVPALGGGQGGLELVVAGTGDEAIIGLRAPGLPGPDATEAYVRAASDLARMAGGTLRTAPGAWDIVLPAIAG